MIATIRKHIGFLNVAETNNNKSQSWLDSCGAKETITRCIASVAER